MAGGLMREPQGPSILRQGSGEPKLRMSGKVTLTPLGLSAAMKEERPSTKLRMSGEGKKRPSKRALAAQLKVQKREDGVIARQKPVLALREYESFLRTGR